MPPEQDTTQTGVSADTEIQTPAETYVAGFSDGRGNEHSPLTIKHSKTNHLTPVANQQPTDSTPATRLAAP